MSISGEIENVQHEIKQLEMKIDALRKRKLDLIRASGRSDINSDPAQRDWIHDGYGDHREY